MNLEVLSSFFILLGNLLGTAAGLAKVTERVSFKCSGRHIPAGFANIFVFFLFVDADGVRRTFLAVRTVASCLDSAEKKRADSKEESRQQCKELRNEQE